MLVLSNWTLTSRLKPVLLMRATVKMYTNLAMKTEYVWDTFFMDFTYFFQFLYHNRSAQHMFGICMLHDVPYNTLSGSTNFERSGTIGATMHLVNPLDGEIKIIFEISNELHQCNRFTHLLYSYAPQTFVCFDRSMWKRIWKFNLLPNVSKNYRT
jgi:hypothetical protein